MTPSRKYFDGVLMAYKDCAEEAERVAARQDGFVAVAVASGSKQADAELVAIGGQTALREFARAIRIKLATVEEMIRDAPERVVGGKARGGFARAATLSPERRTEIAKNAAKIRWGKH